MSPRKSPSGSWYIRRTVQYTGADRGDAARFEALLESAIADALRRHREKVTPCCSIRSKLAEFLADSRAGLDRRPAADATLAGHRRRLLNFDRAFQSKPLDTITRERLERWMKRRYDAGMSPETINIDRDSLMAFTRWARKKGYAPEVIPLLSVGRMRGRGKLPGKNRKPPRALEMEDLRRRLARLRAEREDIGLFLGCMALFGLRPVEVARLRREDYKPPRGGDPGRLHSRGVKGHHDRDIPVRKGSKQHRWLAACLELGARLGRDDVRAPLVPCLAGRSPRRPGGWTTGSFCMALFRLCKKLRFELLSYWVRHSCNSYLQTQAGVGAAGVQQYAGHNNVTTQEAYTHRHARDAVPAYEALEKALGSL